MQDIVVLEAQTLSVPQLIVCLLLVLVLDFLELLLQRGWHLSLNEISSLQLVWLLHLGDILFELCLDFGDAWDAFDHINDAVCVFDSLLRDSIILTQELVDGDGQASVQSHGLLRSL